MQRSVELRRTMMEILRSALSNHYFELRYQPQVEASDGRVSGMEALLRLVHPEEGVISPDKFIPLAEETGLIVPIGEWVLREACKDAVHWRSLGLPPIKVAVNLSPLQVQDASLRQSIESALQESGLPPNLLELEVTESLFISNTNQALEALQNIKSLGIAIAMDDFGTGYSSFNYLRLFPFDCIKIDRELITEIDQSKQAAAIVRAIVALGKGLGIQIVAEGVENPRQVSCLRDYQVDIFQGFHFSKPMKSEEIKLFLMEHEKSRQNYQVDYAQGGR